MLLIAAALIGFGFGTVQSVTQTLVVKIAHPNRLGAANATFYLCSALGNFIGPSLAGLLVPFMGYGGMFVAVAVIAFGGFIEFWLAYGRRTRKSGISALEDSADSQNGRDILKAKIYIKPKFNMGERMS